MNKQICIIIFLLTCGVCGGQNLVSNGDFEQYSACPTGQAQIDSALYWTSPGIWIGYPSDYYNQCCPNLSVGIPTNDHGFQQTHSGNGYSGLFLYAGFWPNFREYIEGSLSSPLVAGTCYHFEMYVNNDNSSRFTTDDISVYFSDTAIYGITNYFPLPFTPQINNTVGNYPDTLNWTLVSADYIASGGESYFIIGNFKYDINTDTLIFNNNGINTVYVFIDDVSLTVQSVPLINLACTDTAFCEKKCIDFNDLSTNNPTSWQWFFPGADSTTSTLQNPTNICYNNYGSFDVTLIACNAAGCDTLFLSDFINEYQTLTPTITQSNDTLFSSPGVAYQWWNVDSGIIAGATNNYFVPTQGGDYYVLVTDSLGCAGASNVITITGINNLFQEYLEISPNPFINALTFKLNTNHTSQINLYDITSRMLLSKQFINTVTLNTEHLAKGIYLYEVRNKSGVIKKGKVVKD